MPMQKNDESVGVAYERQADELATMSPFFKRIVLGLAAARTNIKTWSDEIADLDLKAAQLNDDINNTYSRAFVWAVTAKDESTGKLLNPNIDSQKSATQNELSADNEYMMTVNKHREILKQIQLKKNAIICEHERRGDLKAEIEVLRVMRSE
jgi:hypothetical protein